ncbi:MAG: nuclear transport factor 2 family protein [Luteimonas sp.]
MRTTLLLLALLIAAMIVPAAAHDPKSGGSQTPMQSIDPLAAPAVALVERFSTALQKGDLASAGKLMAEDVLILESGGAERSRDEYLGGHAKHDAAFLKEAHVQVLHRSARVDGALAWVGTESKVHAQKDGKPLVLRSTETVVLRKTGKDWRIVHIHWSSRPKPATKPSASEASLSFPAQPHQKAADKDRAALLAGAGAGQSMVAEHRGVPGPRHVIELASDLGLSADQYRRVDAVHAQMHSDAVALGRQVIAAEDALDALFAAPSPDPRAVEKQVAEIGRLRAQLRQVHLDAHLATAPLLSVEQHQRYAALRHGAMTR